MINRRSGRRASRFSGGGGRGGAGASQLFPHRSGLSAARTCRPPAPGAASCRKWSGRGAGGGRRSGCRARF